MAQGNPLPGEQYLHFKNKRYQVIAVAYHSETKERYVVYQALYDDFQTYVRPYDMFISEVDHEKYPEVAQKYRFQYLGNPAEVQASMCLVENADEKDCGTQKETSSVQSGFSVVNVCEKNLGENQNEEKPEAGKPDSEESEEGQLNPWLDKFLDATSFEEKYKLVCDMQMDITDKLIDDIAVVMDFAIPDGNLRERYAQLKYCMRTRQKYESGRLR